MRDATIILGAPVGRDQAAIKQMCIKVVESHDRFFSALAHDNIPVHEGMLILSRSGVPRLSYLSRCVRPELLSDAARLFDKRVLRTARQKLQLPDTDKLNAATLQLALPVKHVGFGLRPVRSTSSLAFQGSIAAAAPALQKLFPLGLPVPFQHAIDANWQRVKSLVDPQNDAKLTSLPKKPKDTLRFYSEDRSRAHKLQKMLTAQYERLQFERLKSEAGPEDRARLVSGSQQMAGACWATIPFTRSLRMSDSEYRAAARLRLGLPLSDNMPAKCACGFALNGSVAHLTSCVIFHGSYVTKRHDEVVNCLGRGIRRLGGFAHVEPRHLRFDRDNRRPDIDVFIGDQRFLVDGSVRRPTSSEPLRATIEAATQKGEYYKAQAEAARATFVPFIIETFGAWGDRALKFVKDLRKAVLPGSSFDAREFYYLLCSEIAVAVQRGNARTIAYALQAARARDSSDIAPRWPRSVVQVGGSLIVAVR